VRNPYGPQIRIRPLPFGQLVTLGLATLVPLGTNMARGNDDPAECQPASLC
jgi:hypothetical protein